MEAERRYLQIALLFVKFSLSGCLLPPFQSGLSSFLGEEVCLISETNAPTFKSEDNAITLELIAELIYLNAKDLP